MKLAEMPMMVTRDTNCMLRMTVKVMPSAPRAGGEGIFARDSGVINESLGRDEHLAVRRGKCLEWKGSEVADDPGDEIVSSNPRQAGIARDVEES